ncbi:MAG: hypothetical protein ACOC0P_07265 [Planctomycetota bacterium]
MQSLSSSVSYRAAASANHSQCDSRNAAPTIARTRRNYRSSTAAMINPGVMNTA